MSRDVILDDDVCVSHSTIAGEGRIPDEKMLASSSITNHEPVAARYPQKGWEPASSDYTAPWLELGWTVPMTIISIQTLGRSVRTLLSISSIAIVCISGCQL